MSYNRFIIAVTLIALFLIQYIIVGINFVPANIIIISCIGVVEIFLQQIHYDTTFISDRCEIDDIKILKILSMEIWIVLLFLILKILFMGIWITSLVLISITDYHVVLRSMIVLQFSDIFQYIVGKNTNSIKVIKYISPGKSLNGYIGGFIALLFPLIYKKYLNLDNVSIEIYSIIILGGYIGGIISSFYKRTIGIKNHSVILGVEPGGIIDRFDSILIASSLIYKFEEYL